MNPRPDRAARAPLSLAIPLMVALATLVTLPLSAADTGSAPSVIPDDLQIIRKYARVAFHDHPPAAIDEQTLLEGARTETDTIIKALTTMLESNKDFEGNLLATVHTVPRRFYREVSGKGDPGATDVTLGGCHFFSLQAIKALDQINKNICYHSYMHIHMKRPINRASSHQVVLVANDLTGEEFIWDGWKAKGGWVYASKGNTMNAKYPVMDYLRTFNKGGALTCWNSTLSDLQRGHWRRNRADRQARGRDFFYDRIREGEYGK